jgi:hypothetical protein
VFKSYSNAERERKLFAATAPASGIKCIAPMGSNGLLPPVRKNKED